MAIVASHTGGDSDAPAADPPGPDCAPGRREPAAPVTVAAAVILAGGRVLITRRGPGQRLAGFWEFPGGKVEAGESPQQCLERELSEELGATARAGRIVAESTWRYAHGSIRLLAMLTTIESERFSLRVHDRAVWAPLDRLLAFRLAPADIPIARAIMACNGAL